MIDPKRMAHATLPDRQTRIQAVTRVRYLPSADRTTWSLQLTCGSTFAIDCWGKDRPIVGEIVTCTCATCRPAPATTPHLELVS